MKKALFAVLTALCLMLASASAMAAVVTVNGNNNSALNTAISSADDGDTVQLTENVAYSGIATGTLTIDKAITLDLNGYTLTTGGRNGGIYLKNSAASVIGTENDNGPYGTLNHAGTVAAIKVWNADQIKNLNITVTGVSASGNAIGGIVMQEGNNTHINKIANVEITGNVTNGIETNKCGLSPAPVIGSMNNVTIDAKKRGMWLSAPVGTATNCNVTGAEYGIDLYLTGPYSVELNLVNSKVKGGTAVHMYDELPKNPGTVLFTYDTETTFTSTKTDVPMKSEYTEPVNVTIMVNGNSDICFLTNADGSVSYFGMHAWKALGDGSSICTRCNDHINVPQTGDTSSLMLWIAVLAMSAAALTAKRKARCN